MHRSVVACLGADLAHAPALERLLAAEASGAVILALDSSALGALADAGLTATTYDDWLDEAARRRMLDMVQCCSTRWFSAGAQQMTFDGVCWPDADRVMLSGFWEEHALQEALAEAFVAAGVERLGFCRTRGRRPSLHRGVADTFGATWEHVLRGAVELDVLDLPQPVGLGTRTFIARAGGRLQRSWRAARGGITLRPAREVLGGRYVLAVGEDEAARFTAHVQQLTDGLPDRVAAVVLEPDAATARLRSAQWRVPVLPGPPLDPAVPAEAFLTGLERIVQAAPGEPWEGALLSAPWHFEHYARRRWPRMVGALRGWQQLWEECRPAGVLISSLEDLRSQLPGVAAQRAGVASVSLPHAAFYAKARGEIRSDVLLYASEPQRAAFAAVGVQAEALQPYLAPEGEVVAPSPPAPAAGPLRVLALTNPVDEDHPGRAIVDAFVGHRDQLNALRVLTEPPAELEVELRIKTHPLYPDEGLLRAAGAKVEQARLPADAMLLEHLTWANVVVGVNYLGSALAAADRSGRPVVHLWTSPLLRADSRHPYAASVGRHAPVVDGEGLWAELVQWAHGGRRAFKRRAEGGFGLTAEDASRALTVVEWARRACPPGGESGVRS